MHPKPRAPGRPSQSQRFGSRSRTRISGAAHNRKKKSARLRPFAAPDLAIYQGSRYHYADLACTTERLPWQDLNLPKRARQMAKMLDICKANYKLSTTRIIQMQRERRRPLRWNCREGAASLAERLVRNPVVMHGTYLGYVIGAVGIDAGR